MRPASARRGADSGVPDTAVSHQHVSGCVLFGATVEKSPTGTENNWGIGVRFDWKVNFNKRLWQVL